MYKPKIKEREVIRQVHKIIQCDTRQKRKHHETKEKYFIELGYKIINSKMLVGDYCIPSNGSVVVDTKADLSELYGNLIQQHERFHNECVLAQEAGIKLYILIENKDGITIYRDKNAEYAPIVSFNINGLSSEEAASTAASSAPSRASSSSTSLADSSLAEQLQQSQHSSSSPK